MNADAADDADDGSREDRRRGEHALRGAGGEGARSPPEPRHRQFRVLTTYPAAKTLIATAEAVGNAAAIVSTFDGDGALLMHVDSLAVIADHAPANYFHVVFNNGDHDIVGGQPTSVDVVDIAAAARASGYAFATSTEDVSDIAAKVAELRQHGGPSLLGLKVRPGNRDGIGRPTRTPAEAKQSFMTALR